MRERYCKDKHTPSKDKIALTRADRAQCMNIIHFATDPF